MSFFLLQDLTKINDENSFQVMIDSFANQHYSVACSLRFVFVLIVLVGTDDVVSLFSVSTDSVNSCCRDFFQTFFKSVLCL